MSAVSLQGLTRRYPGGAAGGSAVDGLELCIEAGEFFVLLGPSGCGKTTTLRCIAGLERPDDGRIELAGETVADARRGLFLAPERRDLGMVFQGYALWPHLRVAENVAYPLRRRRRCGRAEEAARVAEALAMVGLEGLGQRYPAELSGGQQQRVALARAMVAEPALLLFDEPLSNLDAQLRLRLRDDLRRLHRQRGHSAVYVTHDQGEALALADRIAVMRGGRLEQLGSPAQVFLEPRNRFVAEFVGFDNFLPARVEQDQAAGPVFVRPEAGGPPLPARSGVPLRAGSRVCLAVRGSDLRGYPPGRLGAAEEYLPGRLGELTYQGNGYQARVETCAGTLQVTLPLEHWGRDAERDHGLPGQPLALRWQAHCALVLAEADA